jgi:hypothetical protein
LVAQEGVHGFSRGGPGLTSGAETLEKPFPDGNGVTARHDRTREAQAA